MMTPTQRSAIAHIRDCASDDALYNAALDMVIWARISDNEAILDAALRFASARRELVALAGQALAAEAADETARRVGEG